MTPYWDNGNCQLYQADARTIPLPDQSVHCVVTSPPYFGLRVYKDNDDRGIGLESTVEDYIVNLVDVFREVRRVLRDDGVAWLNLGDSYGDGGDRLGIPERVVLALQADGWVWRDTVIWAKKSAMPESMAGWRWERCRVKISVGTHHSGGNRVEGSGHFSTSVNESLDHPAEWSLCPGCPKCADNDGLVLRRGSWRTTQAHEYIYMLTKGMGYYADGEAVKTIGTGRRNDEFRRGGTYTNGRSAREEYKTGYGGEHLEGNGANRRSVWSDISPEPYGGSHFATFPSDLPRICIQASTSERGCCSECGSQWARVVDHTNAIIEHSERWQQKQDGGLRTAVNGTQVEPATTKTLGFRPACQCDAPAIPATVLDPFAGTFTTGLAAQKLGRKAVGTDLSSEYLDQAARRLSEVTLPMGI